MRALVVIVAALALASPANARSRKPLASRSHAAPRPSAPRAPTVDKPELLFTFDDGPAFANTERVLDLLDQHRIKAVFFVNGWHFQGHKANDEREREILREELQRGHVVGNHTVHHYFLCGHYYIKMAAQEFEENARLIEEATGVRPPLARTPYGAHCKQLQVVLDSLGIKPIGWDLDPQDWKLRNAAKIETTVEHLIGSLRGRGILLLHDVQGETVKALPHILDWLEQENARREKSGDRAPIKIIDYSWLLPPMPLVPPTLDALGRVLIGCARKTSTGPLLFWPRLAWLAGQV